MTPPTRLLLVALVGVVLAPALSARPFTPLKLTQVRGLALDRAGNLLVADHGTPSLVGHQRVIVAVAADGSGPSPAAAASADSPAPKTITSITLQELAQEKGQAVADW